MKAMEKEKGPKVRVTLDLTPQFNKRLEALESLLEASSKAEVIRQALQLFEYIAQRQAQGYSFRAVSRDGQSEKIVFLGGPAPATVEEEPALAR